MYIYSLFHYKINYVKKTKKRNRDKIFIKGCKRGSELLTLKNVCVTLMRNLREEEITNSRGTP